MRLGRRWFIGWLLVALIGMYLWRATPLKADVGVYPVFPIGSDIAPGAEKIETPIQMTYEIVTITVRDFQEADRVFFRFFPDQFDDGRVQYEAETVEVYGMAEVEADFVMLNPTDQGIAMTVWFPLSSLVRSGWDDKILPRIEGFKASVEGIPVNHQTVLLPSPVFTETQMSWAAFPVNFPTGRETRIHVAYKFPLNFAMKSDVLKLFYVFQTGAGWAGPIGKAELIINFPYEASTDFIHGLPRGTVTRGNQAYWVRENFEPTKEDDIFIYFAHPNEVQTIQSARERVASNPNDGEAWLALADLYFVETYSEYCGFNEFFSWGVGPYRTAEAYTKAAELLPKLAKPHLCLAIIELLKYRPGNPHYPQSGVSFSAESTALIVRELNKAFELQGRYPQPETYDPKGAVQYLKDSFGFVYQPAPTPTPTPTPTRTITPTPWPTSTRKPTVTPGKPSPTPTPSNTPRPRVTASATPLPSPTLTPTPTAKPAFPLASSTSGGRLALLVVGLAILGGAGYWFLRRR